MATDKAERRGQLDACLADFDLRRTDVAHEASVGKISEEQINYLRTRGLSEDAAKSLIVQGFTANITKELPVEYAVEMNNYLKLSMEKNL